MNTDLFLVRHAIALPAEPGQSDAERPLSRDGTRRFARCVRGLASLGITIERLWHSPLLRAVQTAELLTPVLRGETVVTPRLVEPPSEELLEELRASGAARLALVGHEPWLGHWCGLLLAGAEGAPSFALRKGGVAHLHGRLDPGGMELAAFLPPRVLRRVRA